MDIRDIRRNNLAALVKASGGNKPLADRIDTDPAYISQLLNVRTKADMGHVLARRIEAALDLPTGWMDQAQHDQPATLREEPAAYHANTATVRLYPLISWVQAGDWSEIGDALSQHDAEAWYPCAVRCGRTPTSCACRAKAWRPASPTVS